MINFTFEKVHIPKYKEDICKKILDSLPLWFGIPESNKEYCENLKFYDFYKVMFEQNIIGFVSIKENSTFVSEIYVLGIIPKYHRMGIGTKLFEKMYVDLKNKGNKYLLVKTLDESRESEEYKKTRLFYLKEKFLPIDVLYNEWGKENPCLLLLKEL